MKYCMKCGAANEDQSKYCLMCGTPFAKEPRETGTGAPAGNVPSSARPAAAPVSAKPVSSKPVSSGSASSAQPAASLSSQPVREQGRGQEPGRPNPETGGAAAKLRELITSRTYEVAMGALVLKVIFSLIGACTSYSQISAWERILYSTGIGYYMNMGSSSLETLLTAIVNNGINILILVGLWMQYSCAKDRAKSTQTTGLRILRVLVIIQLILIISGCVLVLVSMFTIMGNAGSYETMITGVMLLLIGGLAIGGLYFHRIKKMLESAINVMEKGTKSCPSYGFVTAMIYIVATATAISGVTALTQGMMLSAAEAVCGSAALFAFGSLAGKFNQLDVTIPVRPYTPPSQATPARAPEPTPAASVRPVEPAYAATPARAAEPAYAAEPARTVHPAYAAEQGTMLLDGDQMIPFANLVRLRDQKAVRITKKQFTIGKAAEGVDYHVDGNPAVSRRHAEIDYRDGSFYIVDTNSTNHVYVDDRMIPPGMPVRITDGTGIRLGNEMFQFSMR